MKSKKITSLCLAAMVTSAVFGELDRSKPGS